MATFGVTSCQGGLGLSAEALARLVKLVSRSPHRETFGLSLHPFVHGIDAPVCRNKRSMPVLSGGSQKLVEYGTSVPPMGGVQEGYPSSARPQSRGTAPETNVLKERELERVAAGLRFPPGLGLIRQQYLHRLEHCSCQGST